MAHGREDDGFREIELSGKQLVFLFMAATVVSVVIFLCGVLVGRGVRAERVATLQAEALTASPLPDQAPSTPAPMPADADPRDAVPPAAVVGEIDGANGAGEPPAAELEEAPVAVDRSAANERTASRGSVSASPAPGARGAASRTAAGSSRSTPPASTSTPTPATASASDSNTASAPANTASVPARGPAPAATPASDGAPRTGYAVQVAAVDARADADKMVKRLVDKGYAAYVEQPRGTRLYRIRVGTFQTRREAQAVAAKLQKEEKFKPWVTR